MQKVYLIFLMGILAGACSKQTSDTTEQPESEQEPIAVEEAIPVDTVPVPREVVEETIPVVEQEITRYPGVPDNAFVYKRSLTRYAQYTFGLNAPVSTFAAHVHKESTWRTDAKSPYATGLTQFTDSTAEWVGDKFAELGTGEPLDPEWSLRAMIYYMEWLDDNARGKDYCNSWSKALSMYNGGIGWTRRDEKLTEEAGKDPMIWWDNVELYSSRADWAFKENRNYPVKIFELQDLYKEAGFGENLVCNDRN